MPMAGRIALSTSASKLVLAKGAAPESGLGRLRGRAQRLRSLAAALHPQVPGEPRSADRVGQRPEVGRRDEVDRGAHQRRLHHGA